MEWKPDLSAASLNMQPAARPSHCQQAQLEWALQRLVQWGLHVFIEAGVSLNRVPGCAWATQAASVLLPQMHATKGRNIWMPQEVKILKTVTANMSYCSSPTQTEAFVTKHVKCIAGLLA